MTATGRCFSSRCSWRAGHLHDFSVKSVLPSPWGPCARWLVPPSTNHFPQHSPPPSVAWEISASFSPPNETGGWGKRFSATGLGAQLNQPLLHCTKTSSQGANSAKSNPCYAHQAVSWHCKASSWRERAFNFCKKAPVRWPNGSLLHPCRGGNFF